MLNFDKTFPVVLLLVLLLYAKHRVFFSSLSRQTCFGFGFVLSSSSDGAQPTAEECFTDKNVTVFRQN